MTEYFIVANSFAAPFFFGSFDSFHRGKKSERGGK
jgi:hypothetical protein